MVKSILGIVLLLVGIAAAYFYGFPLLREIGELQKDVEVITSLIDKTENLNEVGLSVVELYTSVSSSDLTRMDALVPKQIDNVKLILELQKLAERYGLGVKGINVAGTGSRQIAGQSVNIVSFQAQLEGFYGDFVDFLEQLELSQRIIDTNSLNFQAIEAENGYSYTLALDTYWKE